jgi:putrescine:ornithine antiporter
VIAGIVPNKALADSSAPFGLAFAQMFNPTIGRIVIGMMVISCFGSLFSWQFTVAEVARSSAGVGYFPRFLKQVSKAGAPIIGLCVITGVQSLVAFMTVSPSLNKQFTTLLNLTVMTNLIPYLLAMAGLVVLQKVELVPRIMARRANIAAVLATAYSLYALYSTGKTAMLYGGLVTFAGWMLYGLVAPKFIVKEAPAEELIEGEEPTVIPVPAVTPPLLPV